MTVERYKKIMQDLGMPNSRSLLQALQQVANEVAQEYEHQLTELKKPFAVSVEVPELEDGECSYQCPLMFKFAGFDAWGCSTRLNLPGVKESKPGPGCPRFRSTP